MEHFNQSKVPRPCLLIHDLNTHPSGMSKAGDLEIVLIRNRQRDSCRYFCLDNQSLFGSLHSIIETQGFLFEALILPAEPGKLVFILQTCDEITNSSFRARNTVKGPVLIVLIPQKKKNLQIRCAVEDDRVFQLCAGLSSQEEGAAPGSFFGSLFGSAFLHHIAHQLGELRQIQ